ncbi:MAG: hypothetical protein Q7N50_13540 [Armatimonadota bacterium]|nr:hypothetical protein [Armatimonadota bacterium]
MRNHKLIAIACLTFALAAQASASPNRKLVLFVAHGAMMEDLAAKDLPHFRWILRSGAIGVMTTRAGGDPAGQLKSETGAESACLTLGAGARAAAGIEAREAYNVAETIGNTTALKAYHRLTLESPSPKSIVHLSINVIKSNNVGLAYDVWPGLTGDAVHKAGLRTACLGNSDTDMLPHRETALICMDGNGRIDDGDVSKKTLRRNEQAPYGLETDQEALLTAFDKLIAKADFIVIDCGDIARADWYADECAESQAQALRRWAMRRTDQLIGQVLSRLDLRSSRLLFIGSTPSRWKLYENRKLTPVLAVGEGVTPGLLTSGSTRKLGLVMNSDLAPSILAYLKADVPSSAIGRPISSKAHSDSLREVTTLDQRLTLQSARLILMRIVAFILTVVVVLATILHANRKWSATLALIPIMAAPLMVLLPVFGSYPAIISGIILAVFAIATLALTLWIRPHKMLLWLSAILCAAITIDLLRGGVWLANSPFSYSPAEGSRFYGLGNELTGSLIGAAALAIFGFLKPVKPHPNPPLKGEGVASRFIGTASAAGYRCNKIEAVSCQLTADSFLSTLNPQPSTEQNRLRRWFCLVLFAALVVLVGAPHLGADTGGAIACLAAAGAAFAAISPGRIGLRRWLVLAAAAIAALALFIVLDSLRGGAGESHLGRSFQMIVGGNISQFGLIVQRKLAMNLKLLQVSLWSKLMLATIGALIYLRTKRDKNTEIWPGQAIRVIAIGALAAFIFNDSGVVAAATCLIYAWGLEIVSTRTEANP